MRKWNASSGVVVNLSCADRWELYDLIEDVCDGQCPWVLFYEPDISEDTSVACLLTEKQAKRLSHLPLLLGEEVNR